MLMHCSCRIKKKHDCNPSSVSISLLGSVAFPRVCHTVGSCHVCVARLGFLMVACFAGPSGVANLVQKGYKKISPFFVPYAITNMGGALLAIDQVWYSAAL